MVSDLTAGYEYKLYGYDDHNDFCDAIVDELFWFLEENYPEWRENLPDISDDDWHNCVEAINKK